MDLLFIVARIVWVLCVWSLFGYAVLTITITIKSYLLLL